MVRFKPGKKFAICPVCLELAGNVTNYVRHVKWHDHSKTNKKANREIWAMGKLILQYKRTAVVSLLCHRPRFCILLYLPLHNNVFACWRGTVFPDTTLVQFYNRVEEHQRTHSMFSLLTPRLIRVEPFARSGCVANTAELFSATGIRVAMLPKWKTSLIGFEKGYILIYSV